MAVWIKTGYPIPLFSFECGSIKEKAAQWPPFYKK